MTKSWFPHPPRSSGWFTCMCVEPGCSAAAISHFVLDLPEHVMNMWADYVNAHMLLQWNSLFGAVEIYKWSWLAVQQSGACSFHRQDLFVCTFRQKNCSFFILFARSSCGGPTSLPFLALLHSLGFPFSHFRNSWWLFGRRWPAIHQSA